MADAYLQAIEKSFYVNAVNAIKIRLAGVLYRSNVRNTGIINKNSYVTCMENFRELGLNICLIAYIADMRSCFRS